MNSFLGYVFYHFYDLAKKCNSKQPKESASLYISCILLGLTFPYLGWFIFLSFGKGHKEIYIISGVLYTSIIHFLILKLVKKKINVSELQKLHENDSNLRVFIGYVTVILVLLMSFVSGFLILVNLHNFF